ncbi:MAG: GNAT family N-acetyltransferase [Planctomycetes bacterium]|nr:GNAT family N-acetyltransferase [Planctomycetota bacterium]MCW8135843.1 GNAT family N-acetyltransferase [Planctomycetota bacterium]
MANVRPAETPDLPAIRDLSAQLGYDVPVDELAARFRDFQAQPGTAVLVAEENGRVAGYAVLSIRRDLAHPAWTELLDLCVDDRVRGKGLGALLLRAAEAWARSQECAGITLGTRDTRRDAHRFYEREGFTLEKLHRIYKKKL